MKDYILPVRQYDLGAKDKIVVMVDLIYESWSFHGWSNCRKYFSKND